MQAVFKETDKDDWKTMQRLKNAIARNSQKDQELWGPLVEKDKKTLRNFMRNLFPDNNNTP